MSSRKPRTQHLSFTAAACLSVEVPTAQGALLPHTAVMKTNYLPMGLILDTWVPPPTPPPLPTWLVPPGHPPTHPPQMKTHTKSWTWQILWKGLLLNHMMVMIIQIPSESTRWKCTNPQVLLKVLDHQNVDTHPPLSRISKLNTKVCTTKTTQLQRHLTTQLQTTTTWATSPQFPQTQPTYWAEESP